MKHKNLMLLCLTALICIHTLAQPVIKGQRDAGGNYDEEFTSMYLTKDKGLIAGGSSPSDISCQKTQNSQGLDDYWIVKYDSTGNIQWDKTIGGSNNDFCNSIKELYRDHYLIGGTSASDISGDKTVASHGYYEQWVVKLLYKTPDSLPSNKLSNERRKAAPEKNINSHFSAYPNPAKDMLYVQVNGTATLTLTDVTSRVLLTTTITNSGNINVDRLNAGMYYLRNTSTGETKKIMVSH